MINKILDLRFKISARSLLLKSYFILLTFSSCEYEKDNTPTSGKLKVYYDEGIETHLQSQVYTFEVLYENVSVELIQSSENHAVQALYADSCEAIVISRLLSEEEKKVFASKQWFPKYSLAAKSGIAFITNVQTPIKKFSYDEIISLLTNTSALKDSADKEIKLKVLFDKNNSSVLHYMIDSVLQGKKLSPDCNSANSTLDCINYVAQNKNVIGIIDFAWLSDVDDSLFKANKDKIKFIPVSKNDTAYYYPDQSNFKLGLYPFTRGIYVIRKTGDFTLAKGFESFVAGPKGQLMFLKQGLLPARQSERSIEVKTN
ncbi:MAG: substrate-binding domain-containing protein [Bacteroidetes bacterium]|nr:substrate-binding domain-containing protein [Bacteroidota bacterium]